MSNNSKKEVESLGDAFSAFTLALLGWVAGLLAIFIGWHMYSDITQHLSFLPTIPLLHFYFAYLLLGVLIGLRTSPSKFAETWASTKNENYKLISSLYPFAKCLGVTLVYGWFKLIELIFT